MSEPAPWRLHVTPRARRDIRQLDPPIRRRILDALDTVAADPRNAPLRRLTGGPELRLRLGDWRVRLELDTDERVIVIHRVLPRGRARPVARNGAVDAEPLRLDAFTAARSSA